MSFDVSKITDNGLQQLAAVSATKTLCIDSIICLEAAFAENDIVTQPESYWLNHPSKLSTVTGRVISAGENPNTTDTSRLVIELTATEDTNVKTLIVCAHNVDSGTISNEGTFYGLSDDGGIEVLYNTDVTVKTQVAISFSFNRSSEITISEDTSASNYLLASEVGRFVTAHKAGDTQSGDNQIIRGAKSFYDSTTFYGHVGIEDDKILYLDHMENNNKPFIEVDSDLQIDQGKVLNTDTIHDVSGNGIQLTSNVNSHVTITCATLGTYANPIASAFIEAIGSGIKPISSIATNQLVCYNDFTTQSATVSGTALLNELVVETTMRSGSNIYCGGSLEVAGKVEAATAILGRTMLRGSLVANEGAQFKKTVTITNADVNGTCNINGTLNINSTRVEYAAQIPAVAIGATSDASVPVGGIVYVAIPNNHSDIPSSRVAPYGRIFDNTSGTALHPTKTEQVTLMVSGGGTVKVNNIIASSDSLTAGTYVCLTRIVFPSDTSGYTYVLMQRRT